MKNDLSVFLTLILFALVGHLLYILSDQIKHSPFIDVSDKKVTIGEISWSIQPKKNLNSTANLSAIRKVRRMNGYKAPRGQHIIHCGQYVCQVDSATSSNGADIAFFNEQDLDHYQRPPKKDHHVLWAFQSKEPQNHIYKALTKEWDSLFNYSITYLRQSDGVYLSFRDPIMPRPLPTQTNFAAKFKKRRPKALWFVSHCLNRWKKHRVWSGRIEYVEELAKHMQVDVFTSFKGCRNQLGGLIKKLPDGGQPQLKAYTFYLSFESTVCTDYITEKFWKVLEANGQTIPVALGGRTIEEYERIAPPNSFIHVRNFSSPEALANHLKFVAKNDWAFNYYHQWRNTHSLITKNKTINYFGDYYCYYCVKAHERPEHVWQTFSTDFSAEQCLDVSTPEIYCPYYNMSCEGNKDGTRLNATSTSTQNVFDTS